MRAFIFSVLTLLAVPLVSAQDFPNFIDVADRLGVSVRNLSGDPDKDYIIESVGNGAAFFDYDNDGDADLLLTNGSTLDAYADGGDPVAALYRNDDGVFHDRTADAGLTATGWGMGVCVADYDNDGDRDIYLTAYGPNLLYRNEGDSTFSEISDAAGVADARWATNCAFGDYDRDGDVDLYVSNYVDFRPAQAAEPGASENCRILGVPVFCGPIGLAGAGDILYRNNGDQTFTDVSEEAGVSGLEYYGFGVIFSDFDQDGWPDIYVANDAVPNFMFHNNRDGTFSEVGLVSGTAMSQRGQPQSGMGLAAGDYDGDGDIDIFVSNFSRDTNTLYRNAADMFFVEATSEARLAEISPRHLGWGVRFAELDNDGFKDLVVVNGHVYPEIDALGIGQRYHQPKEVYRNRGDGVFQDVLASAGPDLRVGRSARGMASSDFDNDGDLDLLVINIDDRPSLYRNDGGNRRSWLAIRLEGTSSNRDAIGARVEVEVGGAVQTSEVRSGGSYLSHNDMRLHFGLGDADRVEQVRVHWPSGKAEEIGPVEANHNITIREGVGIVSIR